MGIARLITHLEPFASSVQFSLNASTTQPTVTVDGPGLAFHVYNEAQGRSSPPRPSPSYSELGQATLLWLRQLQLHGLRVGAIFFDGFLPASKTNERLSRLQSAVNKLTKFKATYNGSDRVHPGVDFSTSHQPFPARLGPMNSPFLVAAVIEALFASEFSRLTAVVPGEADSWCAEYAKTNGSIVLTGDSDLLVYDLGSHGSVTFFKHIQTSLEPIGTVLNGLRHHPTEIANRLGLTSLLPLAYAVDQERSRSINECIQVARECDTNTLEFKQFAERYAHRKVQQLFTADLDETQQNALQYSLRRIDPRVSELVHQALPSCFIPSGDLQPTKLYIYLPFLIDDPARSSAWSFGNSIRCLGYSIITPAHSPTFWMKEIGRRGQRIAETDYALYPTEKTVAESGHLTRVMCQWANTCQELSIAQMWRLFGIYLICRELLDDNSTMIPSEYIKQLVNCHVSVMNWAFIHLSAQLQAVLYSLRMLRQFTNVFLAASPERVRGTGFINSVAGLNQHLSNLPPLHELFPKEDQNSLQIDDDDAKLTFAITKMYELLGIDETEMSKPDQKAKKKRKPKGEKPEQRNGTLSLEKPLNMYSVLSEN
ncbi:hypothetical protein AOQ84DRAFT_9899 [Glonium stellatum]|uniref:Asteroid domain-containing protein n=1 Tax=Glonium stellatum TaxID=574774 RepID=A0A8E2END0_9PEZI|nr:hypothetical protein AOQ84DRAFT_9899 [Glonium stellatum]